MKLFHFPQDEADITKVLSHAELASLMIPFVTSDQVSEACEQAVKYGMAGVLAVPDICQQTVKLLEGTGVAPVAVAAAMEVDDNDRDTRLNLVKELIKLGVLDVDFAVPVSMGLNGEFQELSQEIRDQADTLHAAGGRLGVILEIDQWTKPQLFSLCQAAIDGHADYLRISSGMEQIGAANIGRATIYNVATLYENFGRQIKIKAGGGWDFAWLEDVNEYLEAGAERVDLGPVTIGQLEELGYRRNKV